MKKCPKCSATYDDSWSMCLQCSVELSLVEPGPLPYTVFEQYEKRLSFIIERIEERLKRIEKAVGIELEPLNLSREAFSKPAQQAPTTAKTTAQPATPKPKKDIEAAIGSVWLNRIGAMALLLGAAFFIKYTFDNRWIGEIGRVLIGLATGLGLVLSAEYAKKKYVVLSQGLHGAGIATLYVSIFSAFGFYKLIPLGPAFAFMALVTAYAGIWSVRNDWVSSAWIALAGGFATPFLLGSNQVAAVPVFVYALVLGAGVFFIGMKKDWKWLNLGSFLMTQMVFSTWYAHHLDWKAAILFSTTFFLLYSLVAIQHNFIRQERSGLMDITLIAANGLIYFHWLALILKPFAGNWPGLLPLALGAVYCVYTASALRRRSDDKTLMLTYLALAVFFVTVAIPVQFKQNPRTISWVLESVFLFWLGFRLRNERVRLLAAIVGIFGFVAACAAHPRFIESFTVGYPFLFNGRVAIDSIVIASFFAIYFLYKKNESPLSQSEAFAPAGALVAANLCLFAELTMESQNYFFQLIEARKWIPYEVFGARQLTLSALWIGYAIVLVLLGIRGKNRVLRFLALAFLAMAVFKIFMLDLSRLDKFYRILSFLGLGAMLMTASFFYQKYKDKIHDFALKD